MLCYIGLDFAFSQFREKGADDYSLKRGVINSKKERMRTKNT